MSRKQSDYLDGLLSDGDGETGAPAPVTAERPRPRSSTLLGRESALARIATGDVRQVTQHLLDPARCRIWPGNARFYSNLDEDGCRDLIDSMIAEGGQKVPAVVRRVEGDPDYDFEVIAGTRRHWSVSWLRAHSYPDIKFLAQVHSLDDEAAFRIADLENRARKDISDIERARNYAWALAEHYGCVQARMAERLRVSKGWLSKMLKVAELPDPVISAFAVVTDIQFKPAYLLTQLLDDPQHAQAILAEATKLSAEQAQMRQTEHPTLPASEVMRRLIQSTEAPNTPAQPVIERSRAGRPIVTVMTNNRQGITLKIHSGAGVDQDEAIAAVKRVLDRLEKQKKGLQR